MNTLLRSLPVLTLAFWWLVPDSHLVAASGELRLGPSGANWQLQVAGDPDDEWRFQTSSDLVSWSDAPALGALLSARTNPPARISTNGAASPVFYRAVRTDGLYDATQFRTISLTFTQSNWQTLLANARTTGSNVTGRLSVSNGATNAAVGVRYKGNTSYSMGGTKKSVNIELDFADPDARLMGYKTLNLNNAAGDETIMREPLYFTVMHRYAPSPMGSFAKLYINGGYWGVYSFAQQENSDLIKEWFPSNDGDRWRTPNAAGMAGGGPGGPGGGGGGGFSSPLSALSYLGANETTYHANYELKSGDTTNAWSRLLQAIDVLNNTPAADLRDKVEDVLAVDSWLWFLAVENIFADDDSYFNKGADYGFYYELESGRIHPVEHDGNEAFTAGDVRLSPVEGATGTNRPVLYKLLPIPELRQRYLAHMRTVLEESFKPAVMFPLIEQFVALTVPDIITDPKKSYTMTAYTNDLTALKSFVSTRYGFLTNHAELRPLAPDILAVNGPAAPPVAGTNPFITAHVKAGDASGLDSVWLYYRAKSYGRFSVTQMFDDGAHGDGVANDGVFGAATTNYPAGAKVRYYVEARAGNTAKAARFSPARAELDTYNYRVALATATNSPVIINELMADNEKTAADPQGQFDDWIELRNVTDQAVDLTGHYLSDEPNSPRKWQFPNGAVIAPNGYLLVWADENGQATPGLHASFKLSSSGEELFLLDTDAKLNAVLDSVSFGQQTKDRSYGRPAASPDIWAIMTPTPGTANP